MINNDLYFNDLELLLKITGDTFDKTFVPKYQKNIVDLRSVITKTEFQAHNDLFKDNLFVLWLTDIAAGYEHYTNYTQLTALKSQRLHQILNIFVLSCSIDHIGFNKVYRNFHMFDAKHIKYLQELLDDFFVFQNFVIRLKEQKISDK